MNRRTFTYSGAMAAAGLSLTSTFAAPAGEGKIGNLSAAEFDKMNKAAGAKVKALKPSAVALSKGDAKLMMEIAAGGMMQLEASRLAIQKATAADVRKIAEAEVEEQTGLSMKLQEFAAAKQITLPSTPDKKAAKTVGKLQEAAGADFDRAYLTESGVKGHELLQETMTRVQEKAEDADLKALAATALPLIQTHLQVSRDEMAAL
ncbi:MAG TPA: DUF4142 domain-containing protein [Prosthecobacter sp.]|nr:DUF4142 domain-containing protein [Prosthecobacter sp.]